MDSYRPLAWSLDVVGGIVPFSVKPDSDQQAFRLVGELDLACAGKLITRLEPATRSAGDLHLELGGLDFMDSSGIHALITLCRAVEGRGHVVLHAPSSPVAKVLELVGADSFPHLVIDGDGGPM